MGHYRQLVILFAQIIMCKDATFLCKKVTTALALVSLDAVVA